MAVFEVKDSAGTPWGCTGRLFPAAGVTVPSRGASRLGTAQHSAGTAQAHAHVGELKAVGWG